MYSVDTLLVLTDTVISQTPMLDVATSEVYWVIFATLGGTVLGFILGEGNRILTRRRRIKGLKKLIVAELLAIRSQIPFKRDIVHQMVAALDQQQMLGGASVRILNTGYRQHITELYEHLSPKQRHCLHVIHERLANADSFLDSFESEALQAIENKVITDPYDALKVRLANYLENYNVVDKLIQSYLENRPIDVFYVESKEN